MKKFTLFTLFFMLFLGNSFAQKYYSVQSASDFQPSAPLHEMRAVWLTTVKNLDWPRTLAKSDETMKKQQQELCAILDKLAESGINTVLLQSRVRATTIFPTDMEPWDVCMTGTYGNSPGYDALQFAIEECHKRGMKLHAWIVTIPIGKWENGGCKSLRAKHPELVKKIGDEGFMNPEASGTAEYLAKFCKMVAECYDIDGIHLDYIRYPETWKNISDRNKGRQNITHIVKRIHDEVKAIKPWVMLSCSPIGKYADTKRQKSLGWNARDAVCQDAALWLREGLMDCLFPMMYFKGNSFYPFLVDWNERRNGRFIVPGLGIYFMHPQEKNWPLSDITREMNVSRSLDMGTCFFRSKFFTDNTKGLYEYNRDIFAAQPSLQPVMSWYNVAAPDAPKMINIEGTEEGKMRISWSGVTDASGADCTYNIYGSDTFPVDTKDAKNLLAANLERKSVNIPAMKRIRYFAVTATDRYGNESIALQSHDGYATTADGSNNDNNAISEASHNNSLGKNVTSLLHYDGTMVDLSSSDATEGSLIVVSSLQGNDLYSCFAKFHDNNSGTPTLSFRPTITTPGHYIVYLINKKKHRHLLGRFSISPEKD